jgi:uncharacterized protein YegP (UPF0339 family)
MAGKYELLKTSNDKFKFNLKAGNGQVILSSEVYESKAAAMNGIESVRANSPLDERYDRKEASNGSPYFNLKAGNHQIIGTSEMYSSTSARDNGIESVKTNGPDAEVDDTTTE